LSRRDDFIRVIFVGLVVVELAQAADNEALRM
jgi:hypothetical protein